MSTASLDRSAIEQIVREIVLKNPPAVRRTTAAAACPNWSSAFRLAICT